MSLFPSLIKKKGINMLGRLTAHIRDSCVRGENVISFSCVGPGAAD